MTAMHLALTFIFEENFQNLTWVEKIALFYVLLKT